MKMSDTVLQLLEHRRSPAPAATETSSWVPLAPDSDDVCLILSGPPAAWPATLPPGGPVAELWEREDFTSRFHPMVQRCIAGEELHYEARFELPAHGARRFEVNLYPHPTVAGNQAIAIVRDVTERKRAVSHLQLLLEIVHLLSVSPDLTTATTSILRTLCAMGGWPVGEVWIPTPNGGLELFASVHRPDFLATEAFAAETARVEPRVGDGDFAQLWGGLPVHVPDLAIDPEIFRPKVARRSGLGSAFAIPLRQGEQTLALMLFFLGDDQAAPDEHWMTVANAVAAELGDVFKRERMQEQLDTFFNRSQDMHCLAGFDGFLKRVNPAWTRQLGYETSELLARPLVELVHPDDRPTFLENLAKLGRGEDLTNVEVRCVSRDGDTRWTLWNATPLPSQHLVIASCRDITQRKQSEAAMIQSEEHYRDLFHQAYQMQENLRKMSDRVLKIQEHERSRISRDLHDEVGQALTAINMNLAILRNSLVATPPDVERRIADTQSLIENTMMQIHNFSRELRPAMLDDLGLLPALRNYVKTFSDRTNIQVRLDATQSESIEQLDSERKTVVYRIIQEGLNNVAKHAQAKRVEIVLAGSTHDVRLQLGDDGKGFALGARPDSAPKQLGLLGLAERTRLVGGEFAIASMPDRGTILRATIPFKAV